MSELQDPSQTTAAGRPVLPAAAALPGSPATPGLTDGPAHSSSRRVPPVVRGLVVYAVVTAVVGVIGGLIWHAVVRLPTYTVAKDGSAATNERGLAAFFGSDAWFSLLALVGGLVIGSLAWWWFRRLGWWVTLVALLASNLAGMLAWRVGEALGPENFAARLAAATASQSVPIDFRLRSHTAVLVWPLAADLAVLLFSTLGRDAEDAGSSGPRWRLVRRGRTRSVVSAAPGPVTASDDAEGRRG